MKKQSDMMQMFNIICLLMDDVDKNLSLILRGMMGDQTQRQFAKSLGVSHVTLRSWVECEGFPSRQSLEKIAALRGQSLDQLLHDLRGEAMPKTTRTANDLIIAINELDDSELMKIAAAIMPRINRIVSKE